MERTLAVLNDRSKDYERVSKLLEQATCDRHLIAALIAKHELDAYWQIFLRRYPEFGTEA